MKRTTPHPAWCDPRHCTSTPEEVCHSSEPVVLQFLDAHVEMFVTCTDDREFPPLGWEPEVSFTLTYASPTQDDGTTCYLAAHECTVLADRLITERERVRLLTTPTLAVAS